MNKYIKTAILLLFFTQIHAQNDLFGQSKKWILLSNKIEKNEVFLTSYKPSKIKVNTLVLSFVEGGKIEYDYESNPKFKVNTSLDFLDIDTDQTSWVFDSLNKQVTLTIKGGYSSLEDFIFTRVYKIDRMADGIILRKISELAFEDLKQKARLEKIKIAQSQKADLTAKINTSITEKSVQKVENEIQQESKINDYVAASPINLNQDNVETIAKDNKPQSTQEKLIETIPIVVIDYVARTKDLLDNSRKWMLVKNKIEKNDIFLTTYSESKLTINNLIWTFAENGKISYDYESDPKIKFCAGVDFLDIDLDETSWEYNSERNVVTLTLKGGYASLDDFKFKREYWVEIIEDGYILRKLKEHYFNDFRKPVKKLRIKN